MSESQLGAEKSAFSGADVARRLTDQPGETVRQPDEADPEAANTGEALTPAERANFLNELMDLVGQEHGEFTRAINVADPEAQRATDQHRAERITELCGLLNEEVPQSSEDSKPLLLKLRAELDQLQPPPGELPATPEATVVARLNEGEPTELAPLRRQQQQFEGLLDLLQQTYTSTAKGEYSAEADEERKADIAELCQNLGLADPGSLPSAERPAAAAALIEQVKAYIEDHQRAIDGPEITAAAA